MTKYCHQCGSEYEARTRNCKLCPFCIAENREKAHLKASQTKLKNKVRGILDGHRRIELLRKELL